MSLHRLYARIGRLEVQTEALGGPTWEEVYAAQERFRVSALAAVDAVLQGHAFPVGDLAQEEADRAVVERWSKARGLPPVDRDRQAAELDRRLRQIADRMMAEH